MVNKFLKRSLEAITVVQNHSAYIQTEREDESLLPDNSAASWALNYKRFPSSTCEYDWNDKDKDRSPRKSQVTFEALKPLITIPFIAARETRSTMRISDFKSCISSNGALEEKKKTVLRRPRSRNWRELESRVSKSTISGGGCSLERGKDISSDH